MEYKVVKNQPGKWKDHRTGFCANGQHEGMKPKNFKGVALKTCHFYLECACSCHLELDKMYEQAGIARILLENPEYKPDMGSFVMPDAAEVLAQKNARLIAEGKQPISEATVETILSGSAFENTASGMRAKGQLEYQVFAACAKMCWPAETTTALFPITPKIIGKYIEKHEQIEAPSSGAIQQAWDKWMRWGMIEYHKNPVRFGQFLGFEERPTVADLDSFREKYKRTERLSNMSERRQKVSGLRPKNAN